MDNKDDDGVYAVIEELPMETKRIFAIIRFLLLFVQIKFLPGYRRSIIMASF